MTELANTVSVYVRVRPQLDFDLAPEDENSTSRHRKQRFHPDLLKEECLKVCDKHMIVFDPNTAARRGTARTRRTAPAAGSRERKFVFDRVFDQDSQQREVYEETTMPLVTSFLQGMHVCVFAYGATGCGKTHTISGSSADPGLISSAISDLISRVAKLRSAGATIELEMSYMEVYNEELRDLLSGHHPEDCDMNEPLASQRGPGTLARPRLPQLVLREKADSIHVANLSIHTLTSTEQAMDLVERGNRNRATFATGCNPVSSRSHAVLRIYCKQTSCGSAELAAECSSSIFTIIDLAGSERASNTRNTGQRMVEGANINRSLLALGNCITALSLKRTHVPYRSSKLTRLLKDSLASNCRTAMIVCVSPSLRHIDDTSNSLSYADRAKVIKTKAVRNTRTVEVHVTEYQETIKRLLAENVFLRAELNQKSSAQPAITTTTATTITTAASSNTQEVVNAVIAQLRSYAESLEPVRQREISDAVLQRSLHEEQRACQYMLKNVAGEAAQYLVQQRIQELHAKCRALKTVNSSETLLRDRIAVEQQKLLADPDFKKQESATLLFEAQSRLLLAENAQAVCSGIANSSESSNYELIPFVIKVLNSNCSTALHIPSSPQLSSWSSQNDSPLSLKRRRPPLHGSENKHVTGNRSHSGGSVFSNSVTGPNLAPGGIRKVSLRKPLRSPSLRKTPLRSRIENESPGANMLRSLSLQSPSGLPPPNLL